jgi:hypothetical protein
VLLAGCGDNSAPASHGASPDVLAKLALLKGDTLCYVDSINSVSKLDGTVQVPASANLTVMGWAVDSASSRPAAGVWVDIDGKLYRANYGIARSDVADVLKVPSYTPSGFSAVIPMTELNNGPHLLILKVVNYDGSGYYVGRTVQFDVR